jgi:hypothetical protein
VGHMCEGCHGRIGRCGVSYGIDGVIGAGGITRSCFMSFVASGRSFHIIVDV